MIDSLRQPAGLERRTLGGFALERTLQRWEGVEAYAARDRQGRAVTLSVGASAAPPPWCGKEPLEGRFVCFPSLFEQGNEAGAPFFITDELRGEPLERWLQREGPLSLANAVRLLLALCRDLDRAEADAWRLALALSPQWLWLWRTPEGDVSCQVAPLGLFASAAVERHADDGVRALAGLLSRLTDAPSIAAEPSLAILLERALEPGSGQALTRRELWDALVPIVRSSSGRAPSAVLPKARVDEEVQVSVFRPKSLVGGRWYQLLCFVHLAERRDGDETQPLPLEEVRRLAQASLGDKFGSYRLATEDTRAGLPEGGHVSLVPEVEGLEFNPPTRTFAWYQDIHQETFQLRAVHGDVGSSRRGHLSVYLGTILLAEVGMVFKLVDADANEPLASDRAKSYRKIFASYSHADERIVSDFAAVAETLGDRYLLDVRDLRAGERWSEALERLIDRADIFQLFWSKRSMYSEFCRREWEYALERGLAIRPVYWESPMPADVDKQLPPPALRGIHFARFGAGVRAEMAAAAPASRGEPAASNRQHAWAPLTGALALMVLVVIGGALWSHPPDESSISGGNESARVSPAPVGVPKLEPRPAPLQPGAEVAQLDPERAPTSGQPPPWPEPVPTLRPRTGGGGAKGGGAIPRPLCPPGDPLCAELDGRACFARIAAANSGAEPPTPNPSCSNFERREVSLLRPSQVAQSRTMGCTSVIGYSCPMVQSSPSTHPMPSPGAPSNASR